MPTPIDESQLTAYALGELTGAERAAVAAYLAGSTDARQYVADVRATANLLVDELVRESFGGLSDSQYAIIEDKLDGALRLPAARPRARRKIRRDHLVLLMSLAASIIIVCGVLAILMPFVYRRMEMAAQHERQEQPGQVPDRYIVKVTPQVPEIKPNKLPGDNAPSAPDRPSTLADASSAFDPNVELPELFGPLPDRRLEGSDTEREQLTSQPRLYGPPAPKPADPKRSVQVTRPDPARGNSSVPRPPETTNPKRADTFSSGPLDQQALEKATHNGRDNDNYAPLVENPMIDTSSEATSGFSAGVDTASYSNIRRYLTHGKLPPKNAVRIEEMLNYFPVHPTTPVKASDGPLSMQVEVGTCPWTPENRLARICVLAKELPSATRPPVNIVFVIDISRSMRMEKTKLALLKQAMHLFIGKLSGRDRVAIVAYDLEAGVVIPPTAGDEKQMLWGAVERIESGGKSSGGQGIETAYELVKRNLLSNGVNRVVLATDGNWNIGTTERAKLASIVRDETRSHISLTVLGVGMDNLKDATLQKLATSGNGSYAYIDTLDEAKKVLVDQANGALVSMARDVKVQIKFNPATARSYRLIGYERRALSKEELSSQSKHGGELGAGQSVTALYEVIPANKGPATRPADLLTASVTYVDPATSAPHSLTTIGEDRATPLPRTSTEFRFAAAVAEFGLLLRDSDYKGNASYSSVLDRTLQAAGPDESGYRQEFAKLIRRAKTLATGR